VRTKLAHEELCRIIKDYDALVIRSATKVTAEVIDAGDKLKVVARAGIGLDNVNIDAASRRGIVVMNTPEGNVITTAEHVIAMMLALSRNIPQANSSVKAGKWEKSRFRGREVSHKVLGIIGIGRIGRIVAERAKGLKMNVIAYDPYISPEVIEKLGIKGGSLDELFARSDYITIHTPMTKETRNLLNADAFKKKASASNISWLTVYCPGRSCTIKISTCLFPLTQLLLCGLFSPDRSQYILSYNKNG